VPDVTIVLWSIVTLRGPSRGCTAVPGPEIAIAIAVLPQSGPTSSTMLLRMMMFSSRPPCWQPQLETSCAVNCHAPDPCRSRLFRNTTPRMTVESFPAPLLAIVKSTR
jgi:hypothetical protein